MHTTEQKESFICRLIVFALQSAPDRLDRTYFRAAPVAQVKAMLRRWLPRNLNFPATIAVIWEQVKDCYDLMLDFQEQRLVRNLHQHRRERGHRFRPIEDLLMEEAATLFAAMNILQPVLEFYFAQDHPQVQEPRATIQGNFVRFVPSPQPEPQPEPQPQQQAERRPIRLYARNPGPVILEIYLGRRNRDDLGDLEFGTDTDSEH